MYGEREHRGGALNAHMRGEQSFFLGALNLAVDAGFDYCPASFERGSKFRRVRSSVFYPRGGDQAADESTTVVGFAVLAFSNFRPNAYFGVLT